MSFIERARASAAADQAHGSKIAKLEAEVTELRRELARRPASPDAGRQLGKYRQAWFECGRDGRAARDAFDHAARIARSGHAPVSVSPGATDGERLLASRYSDALDALDEVVKAAGPMKAVLHRFDEGI